MTPSGPPFAECVACSARRAAAGDSGPPSRHCSHLAPPPDVPEPVKGWQAFFDPRTGRPNLKDFVDHFTVYDYFAVPIDHDTFSSPGKFDLLRYNAGVFNGTARAHVRATVEAICARHDQASRDAFREEVVKGIAAQREFHRDRADFNPPELLCLDNGMLDLGKMQISDHPARAHRGYPVFTWKLPVAWDPEAKCPRFERFLSEIMPDTEDGEGQRKRALLVDLLGYCLWRRNPFQAFFVLVGDGANGKTTFGKVVHALLGRDAMADLSLQQVASHRFAPAELEGKLVNLCDDLPYDRPLAATGTLKILTGEGTMMVERKGQHPFRMRFDGKLVALANRTPQVQDDTYAFWRRVFVFVFDQTFPTGDPRRDPFLEAKLLAELPGILNLALEGLARVRSRLEFDPDGVLAGAEEEWRRRADPVRAELLDHFEISQGAFVTNSRIREWHAQTSQYEGREPLTDERLGAVFTRTFPLSRPARKMVQGKSVWGRPDVREKQASPGSTGGTGPDGPKRRQFRLQDLEKGGGTPATGGPPSEKAVEIGVSSPGVAGGTGPGTRAGNLEDRSSADTPATPGDVGLPEGGSGELSKALPEPSSTISDNTDRKRHSSCRLCVDLDHHVCMACRECSLEDVRLEEG